jgi:hypothetical protein
MKIIAHRGYWNQIAEKNTEVAFKHALDCGVGIETDLRDYCGQLVISHDIAKGSEMLFDDFLALLKTSSLPLALNIKADGLATHIALQNISNWFAFDMSIPEMIQYHKKGLPVYTRVSEYEKPAVLYDQALGIWVDAFESIWYDISLIERFLSDGKRVCLVSPELHGRDAMVLWELLRTSSIIHQPNLMLCTDYVQHALSFFGEV